MKLRSFGFLAALVAALGCHLAHAHEATSPDGRVRCKLVLENGELTYAITLDDQRFLEKSPLGVKTDVADLGRDLSEAGQSIQSLDTHYLLPHGKTREVHYRANELTARYQHPSKVEVAVIVRVSDRDVAIAYQLSDADRRRLTILSEQTSFRLPQDAFAFTTPQVPWGGGYMSTKPSYEEAYQLDVPIAGKAEGGLGSTFPALFRLGSRGWLLLSETGVSARYVGARLGARDASGLYRISFPEKEENSGAGDVAVPVALPFTTPWRTLTLGQSLAPIVESTVSTDVVEPLYEATQDYKPGRATWSWLLWQDGSMNTKDQETFVDLAAKLGYEYILVDALWDKQLGREGMAELVARASAKAVGVLVWYNSNGTWNDAPQTPRNRMDTPAARHQEMAWLKKIGVKGMKVDFFGGDKQESMRLYEGILADANAYGLMLNFHGATLPRGWERMYPNFMTSEAVTASENLIFSQGFADKEALNSTIFPFTRNAVAAMDYGPVLLNRVYSRDQKKGSIRRTTLAFQAATAVLYQSPLQHFGITPENLSDAPAPVIDFLRKVPTVWDETRYIDGYPGKFVVLARRSGAHWYIAATNGEAAVKTLTLKLPFLAGKTLTLLRDAPGLAATQETVTLAADGAFELELAVGGGCVLF